MKKLIGIFVLGLGLAACGGGTDVDSDINENDLPTPTPTPEPTPPPPPKTYAVRVSLSNIHVYDNSEPFGNGELYFTFAVNDTVRYSTQISAADNSDYNPSDFGVVPVDIEAIEGEPLYIYVDGYDDDGAGAQDPMGTVNTGWYAGDEMVGQHSVAAQNPYKYDVTYRIELRQN